MGVEQTSGAQPQNKQPMSIARQAEMSAGQRAVARLKSAREKGRKVTFPYLDHDETPPVSKP